MKFSKIIVDPPWQFNDKLTMSSVKRGAESNYPVLSIEELKKLKISEISEDNSIIGLWCPFVFLQNGLDLLMEWKFVYKTLFIWVKQTKNSVPINDFEAENIEKLAFGMGRTFRSCAEVALIGIKGKPEIISHSERNVTVSPMLKNHSEKPNSLHEAFDRMIPKGKGIELFARRPYKEWNCIGDELYPNKDIENL